MVHILDLFSRPSLTLVLPHTFNRETMYPFIAAAIDCDKFEPKCSKLILDFTQLSFIEPVGVVVLSNTIEWLKKHEVKISFVNHTKRTRAILFLDDSQFFQRYLHKKIAPASDVRNTTVPLGLVKHARSYFYIEDLMEWLAKRLLMSKSSLTGIKVCLHEIFNNIRDHASEDTGCIFVQHYPQKDEIRIAISDFGVGIPTNVRIIIPAIDDSNAILKATEEGFTSKPGGKNRGAGLEILINSIVGNNKGVVHIHSLNGIYTAFNDYSQIQSHVRASKDGAYPGTLIQEHLSS